MPVKCIVCVLSISSEGDVRVWRPIVGSSEFHSCDLEPTYDNAYASMGGASVRRSSSVGGASGPRSSSASSAANLIHLDLARTK